jgi:hypothetical protein
MPQNGWKSVDIEAQVFEARVVIDPRSDQSTSEK